MDQIEVEGRRIAYERAGEEPPLVLVHGCVGDGRRTWSHQIAAVLPLIDVPTLLLYGDRDVRAPLTVAEGLHAAIPHSKLVVLPGVGHISSVEAAERFNSEVRDFLHPIRRGGRAACSGARRQPATARPAPSNRAVTGSGAPRARSRSNIQSDSSSTMLRQISTGS
jgi:pimeloyl-ACP methyl ester carboxylesterase